MGIVITALEMTSQQQQQQRRRLAETGFIVGRRQDCPEQTLRGLHPHHLRTPPLPTALTLSRPF